MTSEHTRRHPRLRHIASWLEHPQAIRTILFDAGFTLIYPRQTTAASVHQACLRAGFDISIEAIDARVPIAEQVFYGSDLVIEGVWADNVKINRFWQSYFTPLMTSLVPDEAIPRIVDVIIYEFNEHANWALYDDVMPMLQRLHTHYTLGIISDWSVDLGTIFRNLGLLPYFDVMLVSSIHRQAKPSPKLFDEALVRADAIGQFTLYVGDTYVQDILGARNAGINPILLDRSHRVKRSTMDCVVIRSLAELPHLLELE